jgi:hypothetical protein
MENDMAFGKTTGSDLRMSELQKGNGLAKKGLGDTGLPKAKDSPTLKPVTQKGIMSKSGSLGMSTSSTGTTGSPRMTDGMKHVLKGFTNGGKVQP